MPIYDVVCRSCSYEGELLTVSSASPLLCPACGSSDTEKRMSATSSLTGRQPRSFPSTGDTSCCGRMPAETGCQGPGSCCGKNL